MTAPAQGDAAGGSGETHRPGWPARLALVVLPLPLIVLVAELVLLALGVGGEAGGQGALRGFDPASALLLPDDATPGAWRTNLGLPHGHVIPPKGDRRRVLLLGGSNTEAFSRQVLADDLEAAEPGGWEVFNLGRSGYGARRVRTLLEQALVLEPDVVVIYSGHNEFVERVFEQEVEEVWGAGGSWKATLADWLSGLRSFRLLTAAFAPPEPAAPTTPQRLDRTPPAGRRIPWSETLRYHAAYRVHIEAMLELCREAGVQVVLCTPLANHLVPPIASTWAEDADPAIKAQFDSLRFRAQSQIPKAARAAFHPPIRLRPPDWQAHQPPRTELPSVTLRSMHKELTALIAAKGVGWPDPSGWSEDVLTVLRTVELYMEPQLTTQELGRLARGRAWLEEALELAPEQPNGWFDLGLVLLLQGEAEEAAEAFTNARAWDRSPGAVSVHTNGILRELAAAHPEVTFIDSEAWFLERCPDGLVGYELVMDACHLQPGARNAFLQQLARTLVGMP